MADLPEQNQYPDGIYQIETTDPVVGGPDGISNTQARQLASRTAWLKAQVEQLLADLQRLGVEDVSGLQAALEGRAPRDHNHSASSINSGTLSLTRLPTSADHALNSDEYLARSSAVFSLYNWALGQIGGKTSNGHRHSASDINTGTLSLSRLATASQYTDPSTAKLARASAVRSLYDWVIIQLSGKAHVSHRHRANDITTGTLAAARLPLPTTLVRGGHKKATLQDRESGYWRDNESGLLIQWGRLSINRGIAGSTRVGSATFPLAFTQLFSFAAHFEVNESRSIRHSTTFHASDLSLTGTGNIIGSDAHRGGHRQGTVLWIAIGK